MYSTITLVRYDAKCKMFTATFSKMSLLFLRVFVIMYGVFLDVETFVHHSCDSTSHCVVSHGDKYCCSDKFSNGRGCSESCLCDSDDDCVPQDCCGEYGSCRSQGSSCAMNFKIPLSQIVGIIFSIIVVLLIVFACYWRRQGRWCDRRRSNRNSQQDTVRSVNNHEREQRIYHEIPTETPVVPNNDLSVSPEETQEQIYNPLPPVSDNEFIELNLRVLHLDVELDDDDVEVDTSPPLYTLNDPLSSNEFGINVAGNLDIPPPPYSVDEQTVSTEPNNDPPPSYQVTQL